MKYIENKNTLCLSNPYYTSTFCLGNKSIMIARRSISVVISGAQNEVQCKTRNFKFTDTGLFESYIKPYLLAFKDHYPLTNRSTVESTLLNILHFAVVFPLILTTSCYEYIHNNQKTYLLPVGISRALDYVCIRTAKYSTSGNLGSVTGVVISSYSLDDTISFLREYLVETNVNNVKQFSTNIKSLCRLLSSCGYTVSEKQLYNIIQALVIQLESYFDSNGVLDYGPMLESIAVLSTSIVKLPVINYSTTFSSTEKVGIYKFRNSNRHAVYHISPKGFDSMDESGQQISFIFLALLLPTYVTNSVAGPNVLAQDMNLDAEQHSILNVLRALFSFRAEPHLHVDEAPEMDAKPRNAAVEPGVRQFSTLVRSFLTSNLSQNKQSFGMQYNRCNIWCSNPLTLTLKDAFP
jgi:hypothetical protein